MVFAPNSAQDVIQTLPIAKIKEMVLQVHGTGARHHLARGGSPLLSQGYAIPLLIVIGVLAGGGVAALEAAVAGGLARRLAPVTTPPPAALLLLGAALLCVTSTCTALQPPPPDPLLVVIESPAARTPAVDLVVVDLSGRELLRQPTGTASPLAALHAASAQVAFWRPGSAGQELVVWNIATKALKLVAVSALRVEMGALWSVDGNEIVSLTTTTPISWAPGASFEGRAEILVTTVATAQMRTLATDRPFIPQFANGTIVAGETFFGDKKYVVVDAHTGRTLREFALTTVGVLATANPDVVLAMRETATPGVVTVHGINAQTGAELSQLGELYAQPMPSWPARNDVVFVDDGELKAFDHLANSTRVVGRLEGATYALSFDPLGTVLLVARPNASYGTFAVADGRLTSAMRVIPSLALGPPLGLVRVQMAPASP